jgi:hypothetical protein
VTLTSPWRRHPPVILKRSKPSAFDDAISEYYL